MKLNYYFIKPKLELIIKYHGKIKTSSSAFYTRRVKDLFDALLPTLPTSAPEEFLRTITSAYHLHCEMMDQGQCACRTHWLEVKKHLAQAAFQVETWLEAQKLNPETTVVERILLEQKQSFNDVGQEAQETQKLLANADSTQLKRVMKLEDSSSSVSEGDITPSVLDRFLKAPLTKVGVPEAIKWHKKCS